MRVEQDFLDDFILRHQAGESMSAYVRFMKDTTLDFQYAPARHHEVMIEGIEKLLAGDIKRLLITAPPGSAKSTYSSIVTPTWALAKHPYWKVLSASNTQDLANNFNRRRRAAIQSEKWQALAGTSINPSLQGAEEWEVLAGGGCKAAGVGSAIVGHRSDLAIIDDPIKNFEEAMSLGQLEKMWSWYTADYRSRMKPRCPELMITTRWAAGDLAGRILKQIDEGYRDGWEVINLPMECEDPDNDPLQRQPGELLWPDWYTEEMLSAARKDPLIWAGMYQQRPLAAEGGWIPRGTISVVDEAPDGQRFGAIDLALTIGAGDFTALGDFTLDHAGNLYIEDMWWARKATNEVLDYVMGWQKLKNWAFCLQDDDPAAKVFQTAVLEHGRHTADWLRIKPLPLRSRDKETRASTFRGLALSGKVFMKRGPWNDRLQSSIDAFTTGMGEDDAVDVLSLAGRYAYAAAPSAPQAAKPKRAQLPTLDELWQGVDSRHAHDPYMIR